MSKTSPDAGESTTEADVDDSMARKLAGLAKARAVAKANRERRHAEKEAREAAEAQKRAEEEAIREKRDEVRRRFGPREAVLERIIVDAEDRLDALTDMVESEEFVAVSRTILAASKQLETIEKAMEVHVEPKSDDGVEEDEDPMANTPLGQLERLMNERANARASADSGIS